MESVLRSLTEETHPIGTERKQNRPILTCTVAKHKDKQEPITQREGALI